MISHFSARLGATLLPFAVAALLPLSAQAATFTLDFGTFSDENFGNSSSDLQMQFENVATGIDATLTAASTFPSINDDFNGSIRGDLRVNMQRGSSVELTLALWEAGSDYETAYNPGVDFDWDLVFYDLDGTAQSRDILTLLSPSTYTLTTDTNVTIQTSASTGNVTFLGGGAINVPGGPGMTELTQEQADVSVAVGVSNLPYVKFIYEATGSPSNSRNLFVNGGTLSLAEFDTTTGTVTPVPLPAGILLMLTGVAALGGAKRLRAKRAA